MSGTLRYRMVLCTHAGASTDIAYGDISYGTSGLSTCYAKSGTNLAYAATRVWEAENHGR
eukprot:3583051-Rhodomonas_salina.4